MAHTFIAVDFETADHRRDSACAIGLVIVSGIKIKDQMTQFIRPPRRKFCFSHVHGITWEDVADKPTFGELWFSLSPYFRDIRFAAAHGAHFDRSVLFACCSEARVEPPTINFLNTVLVARQVWNIYPTKLPDVCRKLGIPLKHHDPISDARACAQIVIAAIRKGVPIDAFLS